MKGRTATTEGRRESKPRQSQLTPQESRPRKPATRSNREAETEPREETNRQTRTSRNHIRRRGQTQSSQSHGVPQVSSQDGTRGSWSEELRCAREKSLRAYRRVKQCVRVLAHTLQPSSVCVEDHWDETDDTCSATVASVVELVFWFS